MRCVGLTRGQKKKPQGERWPSTAALARSPVAPAPASPAGTVARWATRRMAAWVQAEWPGPGAGEWQL